MRLDFEKRGPRFAETRNHVLEVTSQKRWVKFAQQIFGQVWENLGKNLLHSQKFACSYTYDWKPTNHSSTTV